MKYEEMERLYAQYLIYVKGSEDIKNKIIEKLIKEDIKPLKFAFEIAIGIIKLNDNVDRAISTSLFCISVEGFNQDPRDSIAILSLLTRSAREKGFSIEPFIEQVKDMFGETVKKHLMNWLNRENKSIENFGFSEITDEHGNLIDYNTNNIFFNC